MNTNDAALDRIAREILGLNDRGEPLTPEYQSILQRGLPAPLPPDVDRRDVIVLGAGVAGLVTAMLLRDAGFNVTVVEASADRVGGRVSTLRAESNGDAPFRDPALHVEAGEARIPASHPLVNTLIDVLGLAGERQPFFEIDVAKDDPARPRHRTWLKVNGLQHRRSLYNDSPFPAGDMGFPVPPSYVRKYAADLLAAALAEPAAWIDGATMEARIEGWKRVIARYDDYSVRRILREAHADPAVVDYVAALTGLTSRMSSSVLEELIDRSHRSAGETYYELRGGNRQLPCALFERVRDRVVMNARAIEIQWSDPRAGQTPPAADHRGRPGVYVKTVSEPAARGARGPALGRVEQELTADWLVVAVPFSALRMVRVSPGFSYGKRRAIATLHTEPETKVFLELSERFWEWEEPEWHRRFGTEYRGHGTVGGSSWTDGPSGVIRYPGRSPAGSKGGVVLASHSRGDDALRWRALSEEDRIARALDGLVELYGPEIKRFFTGYARTAIADGDTVFAPGQLTELHPHVARAEGTVHFAGEHTSLRHGSIEGAIESAIRAARELFARAAG